MTFDTAFERSHPPNELTKDSDTGIVYQAILGWINDGNRHWNKCLEQGDLGQLSKHLANTVLTTVRKEARAAAFKESIAIIMGQPIEHYIYSGTQPMAAYTFRDNCVKVIEATVAIEAAKNQRAAANTQEGGGDG